MNPSPMKKTDIVDGTLQSLVKSEWGVIRTQQNFITGSWQKSPKRFPDSCCGILFVRNYAFASNGHWGIKIRSDGPSVDERVQYFFYSYLTDEVYENYSPFMEVGLDIEGMFEMFNCWYPHNLKMRSQALLEVIEENYNQLRKRRGVAVHCRITGGELLLDFIEKDKTKKVILPAHKHQGEAEFTVNLAYFHKIIDMISSDFDIVDIGIGGDTGNIMIKAKNPFRNKPDIRVVLASYNP